MATITAPNYFGATWVRTQNDPGADRAIDLQREHERITGYTSPRPFRAAEAARRDAALATLADLAAR